MLVGNDKLVQPYQSETYMTAVLAFGVVFAAIVTGLGRDQAGPA